MASFQSAADYLNTTSLTAPTAIDIDLGAGTVSASTTSFSLKELICALLAGNGIKLPNLQICLHINIGRLLNVQGILGPLYNALAAAEAALEKFIAHTNLDNLLNRLNSALAEFAAIASMINFCGGPVQPIEIPNVLRAIFGSFLGKGKDLLDKIGTMLDADIGGCLGTDSGFNAGVFKSGILKEIGDYIDPVTGAFNAPQNIIDNLVTRVNAFVNDLDNLMEGENNYSAAASNGGSSFVPEQRVNTNVGVALDIDNLTFADSQRYASNLKGLYDNLSAYEIDDEGRNIFDYILEPELIARLAATDDPTVPLAERVPVYDHCGRIVGYTVSEIQTVSDRSAGAPPSVIAQPGVDGIRESGIKVSAPPSTTTDLTNTNPVVKSSVPDTPYGKPGDKHGDIATDSNYMYIAHDDYTDGVDEIWNRTALGWNNTTTPTLPELGETEVADLYAAITILQSQVTDLQGTVSVQQATISALESTVAAQQTTIADHETRIADLENNVVSLQTELDTNQQSAQNIVDGAITRLNITKTQLNAYITEYQNLQTQINTGDPTFDQFFNDVFDALIIELNNAIAEIDANILLLSENFTI